VLAHTAHEMRQPLAAALAALHVVRTRRDDAAGERAAAVLERQLHQLSRQLDDLLETSRIRLDLAVLRPEPCDMRTLIHDAVEAMAPSISAKQEQLDLHLPPEPVWVEVDPGRMGQVLSNLLSNAVSYTDAGGRLWITLTSGGDQAVMTVGDSGRGIPEALLPRVFDAFTTDRSGSEHGLGLGLAVARQFVELHGGTIAASSEGRGCGSTFIVRLPRAASMSDRISHHA
jgi:signal transduction histidine kinase